MLEPKDITVESISGEKRTYIIHKLPATVGREVVATYPISAMPKVGDYQVNEAIMLKMMAYVKSVDKEGNQIALQTKALIDNHCPDWQVLGKIEMAMLEYNTSFFGNGKVSSLLSGLADKVPQLIMKILTDLSAQSSVQGKQHSKN